MICLTSESLLSGVSRPFNPPHALRRFFARFIDILLALSLVLAVQALIPTKVRQPPLVFLMAVCCGWMFVEAQLLVLWQTTPGKFLLKTRIETLDGKSVTYGKALDRGVTVFTRGLGCLVPVVIFMCGAVSYHDLKGAGTTRWDRGRFLLVHQDVSVGRYALTATVILALVVFLIALIALTL
jgi:uncharacterized RDD family membrane protein YckC